MIKKTTEHITLPAWLNFMIKNGSWMRLMNDPNDWFARSYLFDSYKIPAKTKFNSVLDAVRKIKFKLHEVQRSDPPENASDAEKKMIQKRKLKLEHHSSNINVSYGSYLQYRKRDYPNLPCKNKVQIIENRKEFKSIAGELPIEMPILTEHRVTGNIKFSGSAIYESLGVTTENHNLMLREAIIDLLSSIANDDEEKKKKAATDFYNVIDRIQTDIEYMFDRNSRKRASTLYNVDLHEIQSYSDMSPRPTCLKRIIDPIKIIHDYLIKIAQVSSQKDAKLVLKMVQEACANKNNNLGEKELLKAKHLSKIINHLLKYKISGDINKLFKTQDKHNHIMTSNHYGEQFDNQDQIHEIFESTKTPEICTFHDYGVDPHSTLTGQLKEIIEKRSKTLSSTPSETK